MKLVAGGVAVLGAICSFKAANPCGRRAWSPTRAEFAGYTFGYNHALFAQRTPTCSPSSVSSARSAGARAECEIGRRCRLGQRAIATAAPRVAGQAIDRAAVDTGGFRFGKLLDYRDPMFFPAGRSISICRG